MGELEALIIDTDILINLLRGNKNTKTHLKKLEEEYLPATTVINVFELYYGAYKSKFRNINVISTQKLLENMVVYPLEKESSILAGEILASLEKEGKPVDIRDLLIGSIAITHELPILTNNTRHFKRLEKFGLKILPGG
ncbi:type II toxin-antitoxin system VapC family toxin [Thermococcus sp. SY098]|uniref:type II toxin-antitoxin system VapC family toxin n=1 Tax=Thermococcus sp. SY098 TaxID=3111325 RepID=UPI002D775C4B|nr:type II toxin-antitoxin system VapC family toxin [Thermococcus sp. SY098]WRS52146.1 type II toxin-antitoxin system VapC family toxin [Thermococcus sp. SY098]